jgi:cold shock CspA family protein
MGIFDRMRQTTAGKTNEEIENSEKPVAKVGDVITGTINNIRHEGYGFITSPDLPFERIFFHWSGLRQDTLRFPKLKKRMRVEFQLAYDEVEGFRAIKIKVLE